MTLPANTQILITRQCDAPAHLIYKARTTPELVKRWWSANRGGVTVVDVDSGMETGMQGAMDVLEQAVMTLI